MATAPSVSPRCYSFGEFTLDLERGALLRRGVDVELRPKSLEVLRVLVERHGRLVSKQELLDAVWGRVIVTEGSVAKCLIDVRRAIDDRSHRVIKTVPRRGYIFDAPVTSADSPAPVVQERVVTPRARAVSIRPWILATAVAMTVSIVAWLGDVATQGGDAPARAPESREIAGSVSRTLRGTLDSSDLRQLAASNGRVYERYLLGRFLFNRRQPGDLTSAENAYRQALEFDPAFAKAWAGLAGVYLVQAVENHVVPPPSLLERTRDAVDEALRLDPRLAEAHVRRAGYFWLTGDEARYEEEIRIAAALAPEDPLVLSVLATNAARQQQLMESIDLQSRAVALDPLSLVYHVNLGAYLFYAGRFESAEVEWRAALELAGASAPAANELTRDLAVALGEAAVARQSSESALAFVESWLEVGKERDYLLALIYHALGRTSDANAAVARLREAGSRDEWASRKVIEVYAYFGETEEAFEWLAKAADQIQRTDPRAPTTMAWKVELRHSPFVIALHEDPRWQAWLAEG
jgi:DNA-binding winged helix-turn-helix (wHTH) protein/Flp pilus assembly protein TadD